MPVTAVDGSCFVGDEVFVARTKVPRVPRGRPFDGGTERLAPRINSPPA